EQAGARAAANDPAESGALSVGCWITTCTARWPPAGTSQLQPQPRLVASRPPACAPGLSTLGRAATRLEAERANLHAAADYAAANELPLPAMLIPAAMASFLALRGHFARPSPCIRPPWPGPAGSAIGPGRLGR